MLDETMVKKNKTVNEAVKVEISSAPKGAEENFDVNQYSPVDPRSPYYRAYQTGGQKAVDEMVARTKEK